MTLSGLLGQLAKRAPTDEYLALLKQMRLQVEANVGYMLWEVDDQTLKIKVSRYVFKTQKWTQKIEVKFSSIPHILKGVAKEWIIENYLVSEAHPQFWEWVSKEMLGMKAQDELAISMVTGKYIRGFYHEACYDRTQQIGTLGGSCMRYPQCQKWLDIYCNTPNCSMLVVPSTKNPGLILGRALLWKTRDGKTFMDRPYGSEYTIAFLIKMALKEGWLYWHNKGDIRDPKGPNKTLDNCGGIVVEAAQFAGKQGYPYLDTLKFYQPHTGLLSSYELYKDGWVPGDVKTLTGASGAAYGGWIVGRDCLDDSLIPFIRGHSYELHDGRWTMQGQKVKMLITGLYALKDECFEAASGAWYLNSDKDKFYQYNGGYYLKSEGASSAGVLSMKPLPEMVPKILLVRTRNGQLAIKSECVPIHGKYMHMSEKLMATHILTGETLEADVDSIFLLPADWEKWALMCYPGRKYVRGGILLDNNAPGLSKHPVEVKYLEVFLDRTNLPEEFHNGELPWLEEAIKNEPEKWHFITARNDWQQRKVRARASKHEALVSAT